MATQLAVNGAGPRFRLRRCAAFDDEACYRIGNWDPVDFRSAQWFTRLWFRNGNSNSCGLSSVAQLRFQEFFQHHGVIAFCIMRAINQGYCALTGRLQERLPYLCSGP